MSNQYDQPAEDSIRDPQTITRNPVNFRSVILGLAGVLFICGLTPYNDFVVGNTYMVGNFLPVGLLLFLLSFLMLVNAPLYRFAPKYALSAGELGVALAMMLVSCALPSSGLYRYLPGQLMGVWNRAGTNADVRNTLSEANLPDWIYPKMTATDAVGRANDPVVTNFIGRASVEQDTFWAHWNAVPWDAWLGPLAVWGVLVAGVYLMVTCAALIVRHQWVENERLSFPLASVYVSLIETPERGKMLNTLFRARSFWLAAFAVFALHGFNAMHAYVLKWPEIPLGYDLNAIFADAPWVYMEWSVKRATLFFCIIGFTYFLSTQVAFSLWFFFLLINAVAKMTAGSRQFELSQGMLRDQMFGALIPFVLTILWVGRAHWMTVLRQMFRGQRDDEPAGRYLPYAAAGWGLVLSMGIIVGWLVTVGATFLGALVIVLMIAMLYLALARIVCETGLIFVQIPLGLSRPFIFASAALPALFSVKTTSQTFLLTNMMNGMFTSDMRESLPAFATTAVKVADDTAYGRAGVTWRAAFPFVIVLGLALVFGYIVAGASMLYTEYTFGAPIDKQGGELINSYGVSGIIGSVVDPSADYRVGTGTKDPHSLLGHFTFGAGLATFLSAMRLRYAAWPFHPVGFLLATSYPMATIWFSIFIGWILKVTLVRFGGASLYRAARPVFIGMIIGEVGAAAFWLFVSLVRVMLGLEYHAIRLLPT